MTLPDALFCYGVNNDVPGPAQNRIGPFGVLSQPGNMRQPLAELSSAQTALDLDPERDHAPRDHAMHKAVAAFRTFEAGAKAIKTPLRITISLSPK